MMKRTNRCSISPRGEKERMRTRDSNPTGRSSASDEKRDDGMHKPSSGKDRRQKFVQSDTFGNSLLEANIVKLLDDIPIPSFTEVVVKVKVNNFKNQIFLLKLFHRFTKNNF